jgi:hypothetical protein
MNLRNCFIALFIFYSIIGFGAKIPLDTSGNAIDDFNAIKIAVTRWNDAINKRSPEELKLIYADEVQYYLAKRTANDCVKSKIAWLNKHPKFTQKINTISVYTIGNKNEKPDIIAEFKKECFDGVSTNEYDALLLFRKVDNDWRLIKETDIVTEVKRYYNLPGVNLNDGKYTFIREYFKYNYDIKADATKLLSYKYVLDLTIQQIPPINYQIPKYSFEGSLTIYSGAINSITVYSVILGSRNNGFLYLTTALKDSDQKIIENTKQNLRFKILQPGQLVLLNEDMPWLYGKPMAKIEN